MLACGVGDIFPDMVMVSFARYDYLSDDIMICVEVCARAWADNSDINAIENSTVFNICFDLLLCIKLMQARATTLFYFGYVFVRKLSVGLVWTAV